MLDRIVINENIAYLYEHLKDFDNQKLVHHYPRFL